MVIDFNIVYKYAKILDRLKDEQQPIFDAIYLDFANKKAYFGSQKGFGVVKMPVDNYDGTVKPFFVNMRSLLALLHEFPVLELTEHTFRFGKSNEFAVKYLEEDYEYPDMTLGQADNFSLTKEVLAAIKKASIYTDPEKMPSLNGIFVQAGSVFATDKSRLFEQGLKDLKDDINIPRAVSDILCLDILGEDVKISTNQNSFLVSKPDEISLLFPVNSELRCPPVKDPRFVSKYDHGTSITVSKSDFLQVVNFMQPFVKDAAANRIKLVLNNDELEIKTEENSQKISRKIEVSAVKGSFNGEEIQVSNTWLKTILATLTGETLVIQVDPNQAPLNFYTTEEPDTHIVYSKLSEV